MQEISSIKITPKELALLGLIEASALGECNHLMNEAEVKQVLKSNSYKYQFMPSPCCFSPNETLNPNQSNCTYASTLALECDGKVVGHLKNTSTFKNDKSYTNIFNANLCPVGYELNPCIGADISLLNNPFKAIKKDLAKKIASMNATKITAIVLNADPLTRAHERMIRWTIDKADLVLIFLVEGYEGNSLDFEIKAKTFSEYASNFLPLERIYPIHLKHIDLFSPFTDPNYECLLARSFGADKFVIGQNHPGLGLYFSEQHAHTAIDQLSANSGLELIVLPEMAFCTKCKVMVSSKSCPHGAHHHIKYRSHMIRAMLHAGLIPPTVLVRKEISSKLLAHLHPNRFADVQMLYNGLFPSEGIIEERSDEDLYKELIHLYQTHSMI